VAESIFDPAGTTCAEGWARQAERKVGYQRVVTPQITQLDVYYLSGHLP
jgi:threonyl-tRNA synthetase